MKPTLSYPATNADIHQEALDRSLRLALGTTQPALRRKALEEASRHLVHPRLVLESTLLTESHPWYREALAVSDAFESVTNGMESPGVLEALDHLDDDSPFQPWKELILAIHFFYQDLDEAVQAHLAKIPAQAPVAGLARTIEGLIGSGPAQPSSPPLRKLAATLAQTDSRVDQWVQDVAEGLETDDEDLFWEALGDWLEMAAPVAPHHARAAVLWAWAQLEWREFDEQCLLDIGSNLWGPAEAYRLAALGTAGWDSEGSALLWLRFLITATRDELWTNQEQREARALLDRFQAAALDEGSPSTDWSATWDSLARVWNEEVRSRGLDDLRIGLAPGSPQPSVRTNSDGQLDLFAQ